MNSVKIIDIDEIKKVGGIEYKVFSGRIPNDVEEVELNDHIYIVERKGTNSKVYSIIADIGRKPIISDEDRELQVVEILGKTKKDVLAKYRGFH